MAGLVYRDGQPVLLLRLDRDFGPFFLKFCSYFPYTAKLCLNGQEYLKQQLTRRGIEYEALDNGIACCDRIQDAQRIADGQAAERIDALLRKWLARLPHPYTTKDRLAGYRYDVSILQAEFSLTQVLDRPLSGRALFEDIIRQNLDLGRPDQVHLIFDRRILPSTPSRFRTRVITEGVTPTLHIDDKHPRIKQYHKEGRTLRTETTINDPRDFDVGKRLKNLPLLRAIGFKATDACSTSKPASATPSSAKPPSTSFRLRSPSAPSGSPPCASENAGRSPCSLHCPCFTSTPSTSGMPISACA